MRAVSAAAYLASFDLLEIIRRLDQRSHRERGHQREIVLVDEKMNGDPLLTNCYRGIEE